VADPVVIQVHPLSEVRQRLSGILARFRHEGLAAAPVAFGSHRKPEAVLLPYEVYERYEAIARQRARLNSALSAAQSVQAELPGPITPAHDREVSAYVDGRSARQNCTAGPLPGIGSHKWRTTRTPTRLRKPSQLAPIAVAPLYCA
jgi:hypothetical protein